MIDIIIAESFKVQKNSQETIFKVVSLVPGVRTKTFRGESAWSDAERHVYDEFGMIVNV